MPSLCVRIHGVWYNLEHFAAVHPGGTRNLLLASGRDATAMFESHHTLMNRVYIDTVLARHRMANQDMQTLEEAAGIDTASDDFDWTETPFSREVKSEVRTYFQQLARSRGISVRHAIKATPPRWWMWGTLGVLYIAAVSQLIKGTLWGLFAAPVMAFIFGFSTFHETTHFALSPWPRLDQFLSYFFPFCSSPLSWQIQHVVGHHAYTNLSHRDPDVLHAPHVWRYHPDTPWEKAYLWQANVCNVITAWAVALVAGLTYENEKRMHRTRMYNEVVPLPPLSAARWSAHLATRIMTFVTMLGWPFALLHRHSLWYRLAFAVVPWLMVSLLFMANSQLTHLGHDAIRARHRGWYEHQVLTSQNFGSPTLFYLILSGGLCNQIEHHLFPTVNMCHYAAIQPIVQRLCRKYGIRYTNFPGYREAFASYFRHNSEMAFGSVQSETIEGRLF
ncbi:fatty acid desaturase-domain-containing protein [Fimicolochytrium jonesii]|uniref:fatty acid desaturase-domain-containing protein n=1 Tax=Fimicolochytrium jonesii TaxID=1396493 RepID=UPI0022FE5637|nr:fatty acid desaturase-domain-containing protein [Fimicolochytrium jonesii]KAI8817244.1 fatty acid desaturase-domain-containing protein [Fimicolochytrium jonesii]